MHSHILTFIILPNVGHESKNLTSKKYTSYVDKVIFPELDIYRFPNDLLPRRLIRQSKNSYYGIKFRNERNLYKNLHFKNFSKKGILIDGVLLRLNRDEWSKLVIEKSWFSNIYILGTIVDINKPVKVFYKGTTLSQDEENARVKTNQVYRFKRGILFYGQGGAMVVLPPLTV